jgi:triosephosphate isomerase
MSRKKLIAANWKMFKTPDEAVAFVRAFIPLVAHHRHAEIVLCPSPTLLPTVVEAARNHPIHIAAQDMHWLDQGAYTGETSPLQLKALGVTHVLIGHSERRQYFNETDESVNLKLKAALAHGLVPIVCVGEQLAEREASQTAEVLKRQTSIALEGLDPAGIGPASPAPLVIAYEPVWAIGTGRTATPQIADEAHKIIRAQIAKSLGPALAASTRILYGGSVKPDNTPSLCALEDIDGALVGGASLDPASFAAIVANSAA